MGYTHHVICKPLVSGEMHHLKIEVYVSHYQEPRASMYLYQVAYSGYHTVITLDQLKSLI